MELDDLKAGWNELDRKLDRSVRLNTRVIRESLLGRAESAMKRLRLLIGVELAANALAILLLGNFIAAHATEARFLLPAVALDLFAILLVAASIHQLAAARIDFGAPVVALQKSAARLRIQRITITKWTFIVAPLLWGPLLIVALKGLVGIDAYSALPPVWLAGNLLFGVAFIPLMLWVSKRVGPRISGSSLVRRLMDDLAGRSLTTAARVLDDVSRFEAG